MSLSPPRFMVDPADKLTGNAISDYFGHEIMIRAEKP